MLAFPAAAALSVLVATLVAVGIFFLRASLEGPLAGGAFALFALGRTVGWIGHAIEQYRSGSLIRPRARYVGEQPSRQPDER
jgi:citrate synthase